MKRIYRICTICFCLLIPQTTYNSTNTTESQTPASTEQAPTGPNAEPVTTNNTTQKSDEKNKSNDQTTSSENVTNSQAASSTDPQQKTAPITDRQDTQKSEPVSPSNTTESQNNNNNAEPEKVVPANTQDANTTNPPAQPSLLPQVNEPVILTHIILPVPSPEIKRQQILSSIYIQNNSKEEAILNSIELLAAQQSTPLIKGNLNIPIHGTNKQGVSITAFDLTAEINKLDTFSGIKSITINDDTIIFKSIKTGSNLSHPITITKKDGHWVLDK